jgi:hypothetical protein
VKKESRCSGTAESSGYFSGHYAGFADSYRYDSTPALPHERDRPGKFISQPISHSKKSLCFNGENLFTPVNYLICHQTLSRKDSLSLFSSNLKHVIPFLIPLRH